MRLPSRSIGDPNNLTSLRQNLGREVVCDDNPIICTEQCSFHHVANLSGIARPRVRGER
ncbi:hypothetical protein SAMN05444746_112115 [Variovorax sp. OK212]|nr:hypothetical protein SAMN05518853_11267 [Variovorax sp. OK202]SFD87191.1 hypothetical protein SAMN05444746_112115 [Variovorax sp. OK212]